MGSSVSLTDEEVRKLALLARLEMSEAEVAMVRPQLGQHSGIRRAFVGVGDGRCRADDDRFGCRQPMAMTDVLVPGLTDQQALENSPSHDDACFLVPPVLGSAATKK